MNIFRRIHLHTLALIALAAGAAPIVAFAQTDEIQVYDGSIADRGKFNLTWHNNFTPDGQKAPAFPGAIISDKAYIGVTEWAYGVTSWFEAGLYLPLYSFSQGRGGTINGFKLRALFTKPHADDRRFFYAVNFEFSVNAKAWDPRRITSEVRPIVGVHLHPVDIIFNPILDTSYDGFGNLDFAPSVRVAYNISSKSALAVEEYADYGPLHGFYPGHDQFHQLWAVVDHHTKWFDFETGAGFGLTPASDKLTLKFMFMRDLN
jgi:hypothetical protein